MGFTHILDTGQDVLQTSLRVNAEATCNLGGGKGSQNEAFENEGTERRLDGDCR